MPRLIRLCMILLPVISVSARADTQQLLEQGEAPVTSALIQPDPLGFIARPLSNARDFTEQKADLTFELGVTVVFQAASDTVGPGDPTPVLLSFSYDFAGAWTPIDNERWGVGTFGWLVEGGRPIGVSRTTDLTENAGAIFSVNDDLDSEPIAVTELWYSHRFNDELIVITIGKIDQTVFFDANRVANDETAQFLATPLVNNPAIAFPDNGLGINLTVTPNELFYASFGVGDANAVATRSGFNSIEMEEFFIAGEVGFTPTLERLGPGAYRLIVWTTEFDGESGSGFAVSFDQEVEPIADGFVVFFRFGVGDDDVVDFDVFVSAGFGIEGPCNRPDDMFGVGVAWGDPTDPMVDDETVIETFYRIQLTDTLTVTPDLQFILDPGANPARDVIVVAGVRLQFLF